MNLEGLKKHSGWHKNLIARLKTWLKNLEKTDAGAEFAEKVLKIVDFKPTTWQRSDDFNKAMQELKKILV